MPGPVEAVAEPSTHGQANGDRTHGRRGPQPMVSNEGCDRVRDLVSAVTGFGSGSPLAARAAVEEAKVPAAAIDPGPIETASNRRRRGLSFSASLEVLLIEMLLGSPTSSSEHRCQVPGPKDPFSDRRYRNCSRTRPCLTRVVLVS